MRVPAAYSATPRCADARERVPRLLVDRGGPVGNRLVRSRTACTVTRFLLAYPRGSAWMMTSMPPDRPVEPGPPAPPIAEQAGQAPSADDHQFEARTANALASERTKTKVTFNSLLAGVVVLILLLIFILENTRRVKISYFGQTGHIPLGVALLIAAVAGALLLGIVGTARLVQLRHRIKHQPR